MYQFSGRLVAGTQELISAGPIVRVAPKEVSLADVDSLRTIYNIKETFLKTSWYGRLSISNERNVFSTDSKDYHRKVRRLLSAPLSETSLLRFQPLLNTRTDKLIDKMKEEAQSRGVIDVWKWNSFYASDLITELTFGESFKTLDLGKVISWDPVIFCVIECQSSNNNRKTNIPRTFRTRYR